MTQEASDDLHPVDFVAMDGGADEQGRPGLPAMHDVHRQVHFRMGIEPRHWQIDG